MTTSVHPPPPYLDGETVARLLTPERALEAVQHFFGAHSRDAVAAPERIHLPVPGQDTVGLYMPAATRAYVGLKLAHLMPRRRPNVEAEMFLYAADTGRLLFWGDGSPLTALRTAAVSCAASLRLRPTLRRLVVFGTGVQAAAHLRAFAAAYPLLEEARVVARSAESFARLEAALGPAWRGRLVRIENAARDLGRTDGLITATPAPEPLFAWSGTAPNLHITAVGSATPAMHELPVEAFMESEVWLDSRQALRESGDCRAALAAGWREAAVAGDLFDLLGADASAGAEPPTGSGPSRRTLFKSTGHAAQDLALLIALWEAFHAERAHPAGVS